MKYIQFWYMYRDYSNYKSHNSVMFSNPNNLSLESIDTAISKCLIDGEWFLHSEWKVPDLHFEETVWKDDHPLHDIISLRKQKFRKEKLNQSMISSPASPNSPQNFLSSLSKTPLHSPLHSSHLFLVILPGVER